MCYSHSYSGVNNFTLSYIPSNRALYVYFKIWHEVSVPDEAALKKIEYSRIASPTEQLVA